MPTNSIYDVKEDSVKIEGKAWNDSLVQQLAWKNIYVTQKAVDYWQPYLLRGQRLMDMYDGQILTDVQRATYEEVESKIVIEPPVMKKYIRALTGHAIQMRKSGSIETEEGDIDNPAGDPHEIETIDICMKHMEKKTKEQVKKRDAIHDAMVTCYPNVLLYQKRRITEDNPLRFGLEHPPWNSCVFGPINTREPDMSDIRELVYFQNYSMAQLIELYPKMEKTILAHWHSSRLDDKQLSSIFQWDDTVNATDIAWMNSIYNAAYGNLYAPGGMMPTFMRLFPINRTEDVFVNVNPDENDSEESEHVILPENWSDSRKEQWAQENKDKYEGPYEKPVVVLWQTVFTSTGLVLSNKKHWYQNYGNLPATIFLPCLINGKPSGPAVDMASETLRNCVAAIEYLDDVRKGEGQLMITKAGSFTPESSANLASEANKALGVAYLDKNYAGSVADAVHFEKRSASTAWKGYQEYVQQEMTDITSINEALQGDSAPRQSAVAKNNEISQALVVSAIYFDNFNLQDENLQNVKLSMLPHNYDETNMKVEAFLPNKNETKSTTINVPQFDLSGAKTHTLNDVTSRNYRWTVSPVDDSPTAKQRYMQDAILIINGSAGPLQKSDPSGKLLAQFWSCLDNPILHEAGKRLAQDVQMKMEQMGAMQKAKIMGDAQASMMKAMADMEKAKKSGVSLSFTGEQLAQYPNLNALYQQLIAQNGADIQGMMATMAPAAPVAPQQPGQQTAPQSAQQPVPAPNGAPGGGAPAKQMAPAAA